MDLSEKIARAMELKRQFNEGLESLGFEKLTPGVSDGVKELPLSVLKTAMGGEGSIFNALYESMGFSNRNEVSRFVATTTEQLSHRNIIKRSIIITNNNREKIEQLFLPLDFYLLALEAQLFKLSCEYGESLPELSMLRMQSFELCNMTREIKQEVLSCLASKDALSEADRKRAEQLIEALAKENKQGCQCCCDIPGNNADEDIHADTVTQ